MGLKKNLVLKSVVILVTLLVVPGCIQQEQDNSNQTTETKETNFTTTTVESTTGAPSTTNTVPFSPFDYPPVDLEKVAFILPMGGMSGGHVTPIDHQYYVSYDFKKGDRANVDIEVYSPGDGFVTQIQHMHMAAGDTPFPVDDFRLVIQHTATISSIYIHIDELSEILAAYDPGLGGYTSINVEVSAGEVIGRYGGSVDYNIVDEDRILNFVNPESYEREPWKIHCPDPFDYFKEPIKNELINKSLRTQEPIGGMIDYDIDGRLVGNWFQENTNGYAGITSDRYWAGHLSIVWDSIDPTAIIISIGTFIGTAEQFAVKGNSPDPAIISVAHGLVIYELVDFEYSTNDTIWDRSSLVKGLKIRNSEYVHGVILVQLLENQKLKVEIIPNITAEEVTGFTEAAIIYVR